LGYLRSERRHLSRRLLPLVVAVFEPLRDLLATLPHALPESASEPFRADETEHLAVLDRLVAWNPDRLVFIPHDPETDKKAVVIKFGLEGTGRVFWAAT
jgi:hypothetical protein